MTKAEKYVVAIRRQLYTYKSDTKTYLSTRNAMVKCIMERLVDVKETQKTWPHNNGITLYRVNFFQFEDNSTLRLDSELSIPCAIGEIFHNPVNVA